MHVLLFYAFFFSVCCGMNYRIDSKVFRGRNVHFFRDDLFELHGVNGNKARKLAGLDASLINNKCLVSYGGPQSNSMFALSQIARGKCRFVYYCKPLPAVLRVPAINQSSTSSFQPSSVFPSTNFAAAILNGMEIIELHNRDDYKLLVNSFKATNAFPSQIVYPSGIKSSNEIIWVPQGGACAEAEFGCRAMVNEIAEYVLQQINSANVGGWKLVIASGTGTTALFAARNFMQLYPDLDIEVFALPCVNDSKDLAHQMEDLDRLSGDFRCFPRILDGDRSRPRKFANPYSEHLLLWDDLCGETRIPFDLIYAPRAWEILLGSTLWKDPDARIIYYVCGGQSGNESQLNRYKYAKMLVEK